MSALVGIGIALVIGVAIVCAPWFALSFARFVGRLLTRLWRGM